MFPMLAFVSHSFDLQMNNEAQAVAIVYEIRPFCTVCVVTVQKFGV